MLERLPEYIDPLQLADRQGVLKGQLALSDLPRLVDVLFSDDGCVAIELFFSREGRWATVEGRIEANLAVKCQNCLQAVELSIHHTVKLGVVTSIELVNRLPEAYEPLLLEEEKILLKELVEDELLLSLPDYPKHEYPCLTESVQTEKTDSLVNKKRVFPEHPFSILANLKKTGDL
jgi:uncharacterized protein